MQVSREYKKIVRIISLDESGMAFIETVVALALIGTIVVTFLSGLATTSKAALIADERTTAESLARSQLEYTKNSAYQYDVSEYSVNATLTIPPGWSVLPPAVESVHETDDGIQKITVTVQRNGETVLAMEGYKVDR